MRILWLSHSSNVAGAELAMAECIDALARRGHAVEVVLPDDGPLRERLSEAKAVHICASNPWMSMEPPPLRVRIRLGAYNWARASHEIAALARRSGTDVLVTNTLVMPAGALAARRARLPHVWFLHEFGWEDHGLRFHFGRRMSIGFMRRRTDAFLVNSAALRAHFSEWFPEHRLHHVHYPVAVPAVRASGQREGDRFRAILVGERKPSKGQQDAVDALGIAVAAGCDLELQLVGRGTAAFDETLVARAHRHGVEDRLELVDFTADHFALVDQANVALMCSRAEALGRVTVEAMKLGKPVIAAHAGASSELVRDGWNGLLYTPGDVQGLADAIRRLCRDRQGTHNLGNRGKRWAEATFNHEIFSSEFEAAVSSVRA